MATPTPFMFHHCAAGESPRLWQSAVSVYISGADRESWVRTYCMCQMCCYRGKPGQCTAMMAISGCRKHKVKVLGRSWQIHNDTNVYNSVPRGSKGEHLDRCLQETVPARKPPVRWSFQKGVLLVGAPRMHCNTACGAPRSSKRGHGPNSLCCHRAGVVGCTPILKPGDCFEYHRCAIWWSVLLVLSTRQHCRCNSLESGIFNHYGYVSAVAPI
jgi:hypothetical protein